MPKLCINSLLRRTTTAQQRRPHHVAHTLGHWSSPAADHCTAPTSPYIGISRGISGALRSSHTSSLTLSAGSLNGRITTFSSFLRKKGGTRLKKATISAWHSSRNRCSVVSWLPGKLCQALA